MFRSLAVLLVTAALAAGTPVRRSVDTYEASGTLKEVVNGVNHFLRNVEVCLHHFDDALHECSSPVAGVNCDTTDINGKFSFHVDYDTRYCTIAVINNREAVAVLYEPSTPTRRKRRSVVDLSVIPTPDLFQDEWEVAMHWQDDGSADTCNYDIVVKSDYGVFDVANETFVDYDAYNFMDISPSTSSYNSGDLDYCGSSNGIDYEAARLTEDGTREFKIFVYAKGDTSSFDEAKTEQLGMQLRISKLKKPNSNGVQISGPIKIYTLDTANINSNSVDGRFWHVATLEIRTDWSVTYGKGSVISAPNKVKCTPTLSTGNSDTLDSLEYDDSGDSIGRRC